MEQPRRLAHPDETHVSEDEQPDSPHADSDLRELILPPAEESSPEEILRVPYSNEFILLSFEGHLKPFETPPPQYGERPSYTPGALDTSGVKAPKPSFFSRLKSLFAKVW